MNAGVQRFTFSSLLTSYTFNISIIDDDVFKTTKSFLTNLRFAGPAPSRVTLAPAQANVEILNDDSEFANSTYYAIFIFLVESEQLPLKYILLLLINFYY